MSKQLYRSGTSVTWQISSLEKSRESQTQNNKQIYMTDEDDESDDAGLREREREEQAWSP